MLIFGVWENFEFRISDFELKGRCAESSEKVYKGFIFLKNALKDDKIGLVAIQLYDNQYYTKSIHF